jgi:nicotinate-nucleotide pyrophosphorylase (carboxylating)
MNSTEHLIKIALKEDIGSGDITTDNLVDPDLEGKGVIIAKEPFIIAGLDVACQVFKHLNANVIFIPVYIDGNLVKEGETIATCGYPQDHTGVACIGKICR